jgi:uncharacterized membrane protein YqaE (UPF0057 family)
MAMKKGFFERVAWWNLLLSFWPLLIMAIIIPFLAVRRLFQ